MSEQVEIGQMLFGNATGDYGTSPFVDALVGGVLAEIRRVFWNVNQRGWEDYEDPNIPGLQVRPYYWGDCTCGFEGRKAEWSATHFHAPDCYQTAYRTDPRHRGFGEEHTALVRSLCKRFGIDWNDGLGSAVHCTCSHDPEWVAWRTANDHAPDCPTIVPNLAFDGVEICWYKYPGRGQSVNVSMEPAEWASWYARCLRAIQCSDSALLPPQKEGV